MSGFQRCGAFQWLTAQLLRLCRSGQMLGLLLVLLPFFSSMLITNDVALLTFAPFTLLLLRQVGWEHRAIPLLVLQTTAANLGSMATPVGNPQNLYFYAAYELSAVDFFSAMLPLTMVSLAGLTAAALPVLPKALPELEQADAPALGRPLPVYAVLFVLCLLTVFRVLPYDLLTLIVVLTVATLDRDLLHHLDYGLLATFVCFFTVSGNLGRLEPVREALQQMLTASARLTAVGASQIISNVPAAVLLSGFTDQWRLLLEGVNIGGLGTPIASLASLITLKQYLAWPGARPGRYLVVFSLANVAGLVLLLTAAALL